MVGCLDFLRALCCGLRAECYEVRLRDKTERDYERGCELSDRVSSVVIHSFDSGLLISLRGRCSSRRYGAPALNRIGNRVQTRPHAPPEHQRMRLVSATCPGRSTCPHAPKTSCHGQPRACTRQEGASRAYTRQWKAAHARTRHHGLARVEKGVHAPGRPPHQRAILVPEVFDFDSLALSEVSQHSGFIRMRQNGKLTTSMVIDALFNEEARRREMGSTDQSELQTIISKGSRKRGRGQGRGHHRGTRKGRWRSQARGRTVSSATAVMVVDKSDVLLAASDNGKSDWILDSGSAYHLCRDREVFSTYAPCEKCIWMANNTSSRVVGRGSVQFRMADGRDAALTLVEELSEFPRKIRRCCGERRLEGYTDWRGVSRQGELLSDMGPVVLARRVDKESNCYTEVRKASTGDVHKEAQRKKNKSILRSCTARGAATLKRVSFALNLISGGDLSSCVHKEGEMEPRQLAK
ncbi:hypothetical protein Acr_00g0076500 [Actinidia rufa]|uniref:Retrovirus-related Pol polyprotein from transposon TNT 1-94-like beta-barrel domain-containing protein n=1 Tax=Actinidia rufa TaxID=165716 RepID=A0A7J0DT02_9ERIC|nr:hypothetical protein Acr_00g0076500 [Actinidia rufa]